MDLALLYNQTHPLQQPINILYCDSFFCRLRGLMFRKSLSANEGLLMVQNVEDRVNAAIHMLFMNFDIAVIWLDRNFIVVDAQYAKKWRPAYTPAKAAKYVLEVHPSRLNDFQLNDRILIEKCKKS